MSLKAFVICPECGSKIRLEGTVEKVELKSSMSKTEILDHLPMKKSLEVELQGNTATITIKKKLTAAQFRKISSEIKGYGGRYVKGHFLLPIAGLVEEEA